MLYTTCKALLTKLYGGFKVNENCCKNETHQKGPDGKEASNLLTLVGVLLLISAAVLAFNFIQINQANSLIEKQTAMISLSGSAPITGTNTGALDMSSWTDNEKMNYEMHGIIPARAKGTATATSANSGVNTTANFSDVSPKGVPRIYGQELDISYDDVSANDQQKANEAIAILSQFDKDNGDKFITLEGEIQQRYIKIASQISCEYCCGAQSIIFPDGKKACGCAHSYAMRGLAKYLLKNHPNEFTDDQILEELGKWKTLFFPGVLAQKAQVLKGKGIESNYINLASNKYRGIEKGAPQDGGPMVGGC